MITSLHLTLTEPSAGEAPVPTLMAFSNDPAADLNLLSRFVVAAVAKPDDERIHLEWTLPDPAILLGHSALTQDEATEYQARNRESGGLQLLIVADTPGATNRQAMSLAPFYVDWLGALSISPPPADVDRVMPISDLGNRRARYFRGRGQVDEAVRALLNEVALATHHDGSFSRRVAYALHEAASLAESLGKEEAWDYFETVALMTYPNCHDALIGLALRAQDDPEQTLRLFGRAYAIRPKQDDLELYARAIARSSDQAFETAHAAILAEAAAADLSAPLFRDSSGRPISVPPAEILAHLRALSPEQ